eukprot:3830608-Heterocapsa_arctica.AAC.1
MPRHPAMSVRRRPGAPNILLDCRSGEHRVREHIGERGIASTLVPRCALAPTPTSRALRLDDVA